MRLFVWDIGGGLIALGGYFKIACLSVDGFDLCLLVFRVVDLQFNFDCFGLFYVFVVCGSVGIVMFWDLGLLYA